MIPVHYSQLTIHRSPFTAHSSLITDYCSMPSYVVQKVIEALITVGKTIQDSKILILGLAYKRNIDDTRESPSFPIIDMLMKRGADVQYSDPYLSKAPKTRKFNFKLKNVNLTSDNIKSFDVIVLCTDHDLFDYDLITKEAKQIIDTRGKLKSNKNIFKA